MKRVVLFIFVFISIFSLFHLLALSEASAKKKIIRRGVSSVVSGGSRLVIKPKLRSDRRALIVNFSNLGVVSSFSYELIYTANSIPQGVSGTVTPTGEQSTQRELLFGTCSKNVCRYHRGISGMKFVVTSTLKSGLRVRKTFRIKP
ncbi:MAG: hypothetical protein ACOZBZ_01360 [Patescibacteria group bacterium]